MCWMDDANRLLSCRGSQARQLLTSVAAGGHGVQEPLTSHSVSQRGEMQPRKVARFRKHPRLWLFPNRILALHALMQLPVLPQLLPEPVGLPGNGASQAGNAVSAAAPGATLPGTGDSIRPVTGLPSLLCGDGAEMGDPMASR